jgi:plasmid stability protein
MASPTRGVVLSTYLDADAANTFRARAQAADRSVAAELRRTLVAALNVNGDPLKVPGDKDPERRSGRGTG